MPFERKYPIRKSIGAIERKAMMNDHINNVVTNNKKVNHLRRHIGAKNKIFLSNVELSHYDYEQDHQRLSCNYYNGMRNKPTTSMNNSFKNVPKPTTTLPEQHEGTNETTSNNNTTKRSYINKYLTFVFIIAFSILFTQKSYWFVQKFYNYDYTNDADINGNNNSNDETDETIYVPGAGFSGFWFTLGRLKSITDPSSKSYYCFSAGCLGVVATLRGYDIDDMVSFASSKQQKWKSNQISRYQVVEEFVNDLLLLEVDDDYDYDYDNTSSSLAVRGAFTNTNLTIKSSFSSSSSCDDVNTNRSDFECSSTNGDDDDRVARQRRAERRRNLNEDLYSRINVITTKVDWESWVNIIWSLFGIITMTTDISIMKMKTNIRKPKNNDELREMLIQTTWIPYVTGNGLAHKSSSTTTTKTTTSSTTRTNSNSYNDHNDDIHYHLDGYFSILSSPGHPECNHVLNLPLKIIDLFMNSLNINLSVDKAKEFYRKGLLYGL